MTVLLWPLKCVALAGFLAALMVHCLAMFQIPIPVGLQPYINDHLYGLLGMGIFVVWIPTVLIASKASQGNRLSWQTLLKGCPDWMRYTVYGLFVYAFVNFFISIGMDDHRHASSDAATGVFLQRAFSGHWLLFYGAAFATMYSVIRRPALLRKKTCVAGHDVGPDDQFCASCGQPLLKD